MVNVLKLAEYIVYLCENKNTPISNLRLQQILYILQREYLRIESRPLFSEIIEAREFGPCVPEVYYHYCHYGSMDITLSWFKAKFDKKSYEFDNALMQIIDNITDKYASVDPWDITPIVKKDAYKNAYAKLQAMQTKHDVKLPRDYPIILTTDIRKEK